MILTPDNEYTVTLDACVLVPMSLCDILLRLAEEPALYRPLWSECILKEVGIAMHAKLDLTATQVQRRLTAMRIAFPESAIEVPPELFRGLDCIPDENDRHVLAAAIRGGAHAIVTTNIKDFPEECLNRFDITPQHPDDFLIHQFHLNPDQVLEKLDSQALTIQKTREQVIEGLRRMVPKFAGLASERSG